MTPITYHPTMGKKGSIVLSTSPKTWARFSTAFDYERQVLEEGITIRSCELPSYVLVSQEQMRTQVARGLDGFRSVLADRRLLSPEELRLYWAVTKNQADLGVTMDDTLSAWHIGLDRLCQWARNQIELELQPREVLVDFLDLSVAWWRQGSDAAIDYYRQLARNGHPTREIAVDQLFWEIASGRFLSKELEERFRSLGLDPTAHYYALRASLSTSNELYRFRCWIGVDADDTIGVTSVIGSQVWALVRELPSAEFGFAVGCAPAAPSNELFTSFMEAGRALNALISFGMTGCHGLDTLGVQSAVLLDRTLGRALVTRYIEPITALGPSGADILTTVRAYIAHHGNFDQAAAELFVHPNTVRYRIRRFETEIGGSLRDASTFIDVWWAIERHRLQNNVPGPEPRRQSTRSQGRTLNL